MKREGEGGVIHPTRKEGLRGEGSPSSRVLLSYDVASSFDGGIRLERDQPLPMQTTTLRGGSAEVN